MFNDDDEDDVRLCPSIFRISCVSIFSACMCAVAFLGLRWTEWTRSQVLPFSITVTSSYALSLPWD